MAHSKYSDERIQQEDRDDKSGGVHEHRLALLPSRKYDPAAGGDDGEGGIYSRLHEFSVREQAFRERGKIGRYPDDPGNSTRAQLEAQMPTYRGSPTAARERHPFSSQLAQGTPRATTKFTPDRRIAQWNIRPEHQGRQVKTGDAPHQGSPMKPIWDFIDNKAAA